MFGVWSSGSFLSSWLNIGATGTSEQAPVPEDVARRYLSNFPDVQNWIAPDKATEEVAWGVALLLQSAGEETASLIAAFRRGDQDPLLAWFGAADAGGVIAPDHRLRAEAALWLAINPSLSLTLYRQLLDQTATGQNADPMMRALARELALSQGQRAMTAEATSEAQELFQFVLAQAQLGDDDLDRSEALRALGRIAEQDDDEAQAEAYYKESLRIEDALAREPEQAWLRMSLGLIARRDDRDSDAVALLEMARDFYDRVGDRRCMAVIEGSLGEIALIGAAFQQARDHFTQALRLEQQRGDKASEAACWANLGLADRRLGFGKSAEKALRTAARLYTELLDPVGEERCYGGLAALAVAEGDLRSADRWFSRLQKSYVTRQEWELLFQVTQQLILIALKRDLPDQAEAYVRQAQALMASAAKGDVEVRLQVFWAEQAEREGDRAQAVERLVQGLEKAVADQLPDLASNMADRLGHLYRELGQLAEAETYFQTALTLDEALENDFNQALDTANLGVIAAEEARREAAESAWMQARQMFADLGCSDQVAELDRWLSRLKPATA